MSYTYLSTQTASGSTELDFINLNNSYSSYRFVINNLILSNTTTFQAKTSTDNLSSFSTNSASTIQYGSTTNSNAPMKVATRTSYVPLCSTDAGLRAVVGFVDIEAIGESSNQIQGNFDVSMSGVNNSPRNYTGYFSDELREAINAVRFKPSVGTIVSGSISLYGIS
jgi:hypothetical protein